MAWVVLSLLAAGSLSGFGQTLMAREAQTATPTPAQTSQTPAAQTPGSDLLRVFVDCNDCDEEYLKQNVGFIDYVRDRAVADLHVLVTTQPTGGGGEAWTVKFIGLGRFQGQDRSLAFTTIQTATNDERRREFARVFKLGLVAYMADTPAAAQLDVTWKKGADEKANESTKDRWNFWVFRAGTNGNMNGERSSKSQSFRLNFSGNRTTDAWKVNLNSNASYSQDKFDVPEEDISVKSTSTSWSFTSLVVKSLGPKWSFGSRADVAHSSFSNNDRSFTVAPGVEYDVFPYSQSAERLLTVQYTAGVSHFKYRELTIYDKIVETVPTHRVAALLALKQPWGSLHLESSLSEQLNEFSRYRATVFGEAEVRLFKGFSFDLFGEYQKINDQIGLRKEPVSTEDVLLRQQQLATSYSYFFSFGISYSFGSIFNSVVNPRFGGG